MNVPGCINYYLRPAGTALASSPKVKICFPTTLRVDQMTACKSHGYRPKACLFLTERWRIWRAMCLARFQVAITLFILDASLMPKSGRIANRYYITVENTAPLL